jgi:hypothetical protein
MRYASIVRKSLKFLYVTLQTLNVRTPCHTAHVNPTVHFCPDSLQHVSGDDALSHFLKIRGGTYTTALTYSQPLHSCPYKIAVESPYCNTVSPGGGGPNTFPRQLLTNFESFPNKCCISCDCRLTGYFIINV